MLYKTLVCYFLNQRCRGLPRRAKQTEKNVFYSGYGTLQTFQSDQEIVPKAKITIWK